ncbi:hypothetical protein EMCG_09478 [[Emmonsia] crescens]|uniref:Uncharacterized protein n=1 Tax=[Emmonsia] crescens TaxID=73230 RepID=A0A0G2J320_9EURO|nr:hypothetical protein EMCG_09478 [Emmonsia crescens UAMH 3008]
MLPRSRTVVSRLLLSARACDTSCSTVSRSEELAMVCLDLSWRAVPRVARLSCLES